MKKIPFDIKFRPQIESGEYKVETKSGVSVRIICWDARGSNNREDIIGLIGSALGSENIQRYNTQGRLITDSARKGDKDLFIVTPEPELTEFEQEVCTVSNLRLNLEMKDEIRSAAKQLLAIAKRELCSGCNANLEGYIRGREDAKKEMEENRVYKHEMPYMPTYSPCHYGGECTNPFHDCINCPRGSVTVGINTSTGTSTAKVEG